VIDIASLLEKFTLTMLMKPWSARRQNLVLGSASAQSADYELLSASLCDDYKPSGLFSLE
jgi:hypothetical protein